MNDYYRREAGSQAGKIGLPGQKHDLDGHSLNDFRIVARRVVGREKRKLRTTGGRQLVDFAMELSIRECIDANVGQIANPHVGQLRFLEVRLHPDIALHEIDGLRTGSDELTGEHETLANGAIRWGQNARVSEVHLCNHDGGFPGCYISFINIVFCVEGFSLALSGLKLALTCSESRPGAREVRFARIQLAG